MVHCPLCAADAESVFRWGRSTLVSPQPTSESSLSRKWYMVRFHSWLGERDSGVHAKGVFGFCQVVPLAPHQLFQLVEEHWIEPKHTFVDWCLEDSFFVEWSRFFFCRASSTAVNSSSGVAVAAARKPGASCLVYVREVYDYVDCFCSPMQDTHTHNTRAQNTSKHEHTQTNTNERQRT